MSVVSPEYYIEEITKGKSYEELIKLRGEFIEGLIAFEKEYIFKPDSKRTFSIHPSPEVI